MLPNDVLVDVAFSLTRADIDALEMLNVTTHLFVQARLNGRGPLRYVENAVADGTTLICGPDFNDDAEDFVRHLSNCYVENLSLHGDVFDSAQVALLESIKGTYVVHCLELSGRNPQDSMRLLNVVPACTALTWNFSLPDGFFQSAALNSVQSLSIVDTFTWEAGDAEAAAHWLSTRVSRDCERKMTMVLINSSFDPMPLALKKHFLADTEPRRYRLLLSGSTSNIQSETLHNTIGDVLDVEDSFDGLFIERLPFDSATRRRIGESTEGPKVWDFLSVEDLERYFVASETAVLELLARSGLVANEMRCRCGSEMYLRKRRPIPRSSLDAPTPSTPFYYRWRCAGSCTDARGNHFAVYSTTYSFFKDTGQYLGDCDELLKLTVLLCSGKSDAEICDAMLDIREKYIHYFREECVDKLGWWFPERADASCRDTLVRFYETVKSKYPVEDVVRLPEGYDPWN